MSKRPLKENTWFPYAAAGVITVVAFVLLTQFSEIWGGMMTFIGYFKAVILGCVIAYIVNPLAKLFHDKVFKGMNKEKTKTAISNLLAFLIVVAFLVFALVTLIPQLVQSITMFIDNLDGYVETLDNVINNLGLSSAFNLEKLISSSEDLIKTISDFLEKHFQTIIATSTALGKNVVTWLIAFILSIYLLGEKENLKKGATRLLTAVFGQHREEGMLSFFRRCDAICSRYIVFNLIDSLLVGSVNAVFMTIMGMEYVGLVSFIVGIMNLIPTFGPIIGAAIGSFVLLMVNPGSALFFLIFTLILQILDGYIIKPKLFGNSLGVSGLWILVGVIVGGNLFGVVGILVAIPTVAILDLLYHDYLLPILESRHEKKGEPEEDGDEIQ